MNFTRCITGLAVLITIVISSVPCGHAFDDGKAGGEKSDHGKLNPAAPPETAQFDFLVGDWYVEIPARTAGGDPVTY